MSEGQFQAYVPRVSTCQSAPAVFNISCSESLRISAVVAQELISKFSHDLCVYDTEMAQPFSYVTMSSRQTLLQGLSWTMRVWIRGRTTIALVSRVGYYNYLW